MRATPYHASELLGEADLLAAATTCPGCGASGPRSCVHTIQHEPRVELVRCARCGLASASRMPTLSALDRYYAKYYRSDIDAPAVTFADPRRFGRHLARIAGRWLSPRRALRILDFGGGDGTLGIAAAVDLVRAGAESVHVEVVDQCPLRASDSAAVSISAAPSLEETSGRFDLVIASAILEHIPELRDTLVRLLGHLSSDSLLYARAPYWQPLLRVVPNVDLTFPGHVHDIGPTFWRFVPTLAPGLELVASRAALVETTLRSAPLRTLAAHSLKLPSRVESALRGPCLSEPWWGLVGGWEAVVRRTAETNHHG